jgi:hypothetical protein
VLQGIKDIGTVSTEFAEFTDLLDQGEKTLRDARKQVESGLDAIGAEGGRIVIMVDDLDRLGQEELISMLRLLRIAGDLPYVTILVALDLDKVRSVLKDAGPGYGPEFIEKVIPAGIHVPYPEEGLFRELVGSQISQVLDEAQVPAPEWLHRSNRLFRFTDELEVLLQDVRTPRDLTRLINALRLLFLAAAEDPDLNGEDAIWLETLHVFYPEAYEWVRQNRTFLTGEGTEIDAMFRLEEYAKARSEQLSRGLAIYEGDATRQARVRHILTRLFGPLEAAERRDLDEQSVFASERRIRDPDSFNRYFGFSRVEGWISAADVRLTASTIVTLAESRKIEEIAGILSGYDSLAQDARARFIRDLRQTLHGTPPDISARLGEGVLQCIPKVGSKFGMMLAWIAAMRIAGPSDHLYFDKPDRERYFEEFMRGVGEVLPISEAALVIARAGITVHKPKLLDQARRAWLQRYDGMRGEPMRAVGAADDDGIEPVGDLIEYAIQHLLSLSTKKRRPKLPWLDEKIIEYCKQDPDHLLNLLGWGMDAARDWSEYEAGAHVRRTRAMLGPNLMNTLAAELDWTSSTNVQVGELFRQSPVGDEYATHTES